MLKVLNRISDAVNEGTKNICAVLIAYLAVVCVLQVFFRRFLNNSLSWSEESMRYVFVWMIMLATATTVKEGSGAAIDLLRKRLEYNPKSLAVQQFIVFFLTGLTSFFLFTKGIRYSLAAVGRTSAAIGIPMELVYAAIPVGSFLTLLHCVNGLALSVNDYRISGKASLAAEGGDK